MNNTMSMENQIKMVYSSLTKTEKKVANYILKNMENVYNQTLTQMSKFSHVGEATVMRFIYKLGYESLAQFKLAVAKDNFSKPDNQKYEDSNEGYAKKVYDLMLDTLKINSKETFKKVAEMIQNASHIYFCGNGTSGYAAQVASYRFFRAGVPCESITDVHYMAMKSSVVHSDELIVAISLSGDNIDLINSVKRAKKKGCPIVTISGHRLTSLSEQGDINLYHAPLSLNDKSYYGGTTGIFLQEYLLELIFKEFEAMNPEQVEQMHIATTEATNRQHESLKEEE